MDPLTAIALGLEIQRFNGRDDTADVLSGSLDALQSGAWTLSPYEGPAIQPYFQIQLKQLGLGIAPSGSWRQDQATAADGREGTMRISQWKLDGRIFWSHERFRFGLDAGVSSGSAHINGEPIADATTSVRVTPNVGLNAPLTDHLSAVGRVLWGFELLDDGLLHGPKAAFALEWTP